MPSSYTSNNGLELMVTGENAGTWGDKTNTSLSIIDRVTTGVGEIALSGTTHTLTTTDATLSDGHYRVLVFGGTPSGTNTVTITPNDQEKYYIVKNNSGQSVVMTQGSGGNVTIANGKSAIVYADGTGAGAAVVDVTSTFNFQPLTATLTAIGALAVTDGNIIVGDGSTWVAESGSTARASLGLAIGTNVQAYDPALQSISGLTTSADQMIYTTASDTYATTSLTAAGRAILDDADAAAQRTTLGLGTIATQAANNVSITGGSITGITDLAVSDGGTGASSFTANNVLLGNGTSAFQVVAPGTNGNVLTSNGTTWTSAPAGAALSGQTDSASPFETSLGSGAGAVVTGVNNTFIGFEAGNDVTTGTDNVVVGYQALDAATTAIGNVAIGSGAAGAVTTGGNNVAIGNGALDAATTGGRNIAIGQDSLGSATTAGRNIAIGTEAMGLGIATDSAGYNVVMGYQAGYDITSGAYNHLFGYRSGYDITTGLHNVGIGFSSLLAITTGSNNVALGNGALDAATTGGTNVAIGQNAMGSGVATAASGGNIAIGVTAGNAITSGTNNVAIGTGALDAATTGGENIAIGLDAGGGVSTATRTVFIGPSAGSNASNGMGIGYRAARYSSAESNTAVGNSALADTLLTGNTNSAFGYQALLNVESGNGNTGVGYVAGSNITTGSNNMVLGNLAQASSATVSNEITLGDSSITNFRVPGVGFQFDTTDGLIVPKTVTAAGTTGAQTINKTAGTVNFAAAATSLVVTNSFVDTNSIIIATVGTNDSTMKSVAAVAGAGSFTLHANAAATAETRVNWFVVN